MRSNSRDRMDDRPTGYTHEYRRHNSRSNLQAQSNNVATPINASQKKPAHGGVQGQFGTPKQALAGMIKRTNSSLGRSGSRNRYENSASMNPTAYLSSQ